MLAFTHLAFGLLSGLLALPLVKPESTATFLIVTAAAALLPDIDHHGSTINRIFFFTKLVPMLFRHRGFFHSIWPAAIIGAILFYTTTPTIASAVVLGYLSHLLADSFTREGVNWLYPLFKFKIQGFITTGTLLETVVLCVIIGLIGLKVLG